MRVLSSVVQTLVLTVFEFQAYFAVGRGETLELDGNDHLIEMPLVTKGAGPGSDSFGGLLAKLLRPGTQRFIRDVNTTCGQHFLHHAQTQGKAKVQPHRIAYDRRREAVASIGNRIGWWRSGHDQIFAALIGGLT